MRLIGLTGKARSGKSTVGEALAKHGFRCMAFADPLKNAAAGLFQLTEAQLDGDEKEVVIDWLGKSPRQVLQLMGTEFGRGMIAPDLWITLAERRCRIALGNKGISGIVLTDVRFENEADWIRAQGGSVWHIKRPDAAPVNRHASENGVQIDRADKVIDNSGTLACLHKQINALLMR